MHRMIALAEKPSILVDFVVNFLKDNEQKNLFRTQSQMAEKTVIIYGKSCEINCSEQHILAVSLPYMPAGILLELPMKSSELFDDKNDYEMILMILEFPYISKSQFDMLENVVTFLNKADEPKRFKIVKMNNHKGAVTDLKLKETELEDEIKNHFTMKNIPQDMIEISDLTEPELLIDLFRGGDKSIMGAIEYEKINITEIIKKMPNELKANYNFYLMQHGLSFDQDDFEEYIRFDVVKNCKDLLKKYTDNFLNSRKYKNIKQDLCDLFRSYISQICCWDIEKDVQMFSQEFDRFVHKKLAFKHVIKGPKNETDYEIMRAKDRCDIVFIDKCHDLVEKELYSFIEEQIINRGKVYLADNEKGV